MTPLQINRLRRQLKAEFKGPAIDRLCDAALATAQARVEALEEAAKLAEEIWSEGASIAIIAPAIRALKGTE